ncbi:MAG: energy transducer TonB [Acidobacteria bacterium]|nr:energy transducer TonB [Acidobacteriota bacterium]
MKQRKKAFASFACSLALAANSVCVLAQDKPKTETQVERKVILKTPDGQTQEFTVQGDGGVFVTPDGKKIQVRTTSNQDGSAQHVEAQVITSQDGKEVKTVRTQDGKEIKVVTTQSGDGKFDFVVTPGAGGTATFRSQDGTTHNLDGQNFTFVRGGNGQDFTYNFVSSEMSFDNKLVKGAPFSAEIENETVKTLADGNRIVHKNTGSIARDGEGRMRRENTVNAIGSFSGNEAAKTITINDPVAGTMFMLEPQTRTARKIGGVRSPAPHLKETTVSTGADLRKINVSNGVLQGSAIKKPAPSYPPVAKAAKASGTVQVQITVSEDGKVIDATAISGHPLLREAALEAARQWEFKPTELSGQPVKVQGILTFNFTLAGEDNNSANQISERSQLPEKVRMAEFNSNTESLGKQTFDGVVAEGKRTTTTIPAGAIGNERPIEIVSESWYSPELQTVVMSKRTDPTSGETNYRLMNIRRGEPDASLFQVPSDYTVKEGGFGFVGAGGATGTFNMRVPKPDNK